MISRIRIGSLLRSDILESRSENVKMLKHPSSAAFCPSLTRRRPRRGHLRLIRSLGVAALLLACTFLQNAHSQNLTVDEIIAKNISARGGAENWAKVLTLKLQGTYVNFSDATPFTIWRQRPDLYRFDSIRLGEQVIHAYDAEKAWWVNPLLGPPNDKPVPIPSKGNHDRITLRERFFEPVFWDYENKGVQVELAGKEEVDGVDCYKFEVTLADSTVEFWYIDSETFLENKMTGPTYDFGRKCDQEMFFGDYREIGGVKLPFLIESEYFIRYRTMEIAQVEINPEIMPAVFAMPDSTTWKSN